MRSDLFTNITDVEKCYYKDSCESYGTDICNWTTCPALIQTKYLLDLSNLPPKYHAKQQLDITMFESGLDETVSNYITNSVNFVQGGYNAYFYGGTGTGKTSVAIQIMTNYFANICSTNDYECRGLFVSVASFLRDAKLSITYKNSDQHEF